MGDPDEERWLWWSGREELVSECGGDQGLARLIFRVVDVQALDYLDDRPPVLEGSSPRELLRSRRGKKRLREALKGFPYI